MPLNSAPRNLLGLKKKKSTSRVTLSHCKDLASNTVMIVIMMYQLLVSVNILMPDT